MICLNEKICGIETFASLGQSVLISWGHKISSGCEETRITEVKSEKCFLRVSTQKLSGGDKATSQDDSQT